MRISDWSSDVCSSDLGLKGFDVATGAALAEGLAGAGEEGEVADEEGAESGVGGQLGEVLGEPGAGDRKSVVSGKSVSGRVDLGGRRIINKKNNSTTLCISVQQHKNTNRNQTLT